MFDNKINWFQCLGNIILQKSSTKSNQMTFKDTSNGTKSRLKIVDLMNSFDSDASIQIVVGQSQNSEKREANTSKTAGNGSLSKGSLMTLQQFKSKIQQRAKSKNEAINVDSSLAPSLHTRAKGSVKMLNQFLPKSIELQEKQFKQGRYEYAQNYNTKLSKEARVSFPLKQTKLPVVKLDDMRNYGFGTFQMPKPGESIYPPKKKPQPERPIFRGVQFSLISNNKYNLTEKQKEQKRKQKQQQKKKQKQSEQRAKQESLKHIQNMFYNFVGSSKNGGKMKQQNNGQQDDGELKNLDILEEIQNQQQHQDGTYFETDQERLAQQKRMKYSLSEVVRPYDTMHAFPFVKAILGYKFSSNSFEPSSSRRIPDVFTDADVYKKTFHLLVINECIADLQQRMKKLQKDTAEKMEIQIISIAQNSNGLTELKVKEMGGNMNTIIPESDQEKQVKKAFKLKNYSMSKNRIGVITSNDNFRMKNFGIHSYGREKDQLQFTFLCLLKTPQSKQQLKDDVRVQACISESDLQFVLKMKNSKKAYFYDMQKLSTNIREYMSISNIQYSFLAPHIYNPNFIETEKRDLVDHKTRGLINDVFGVLEKDFNKTQFQSIRQMALRESGIVLLQGPPGTGKTSTLLGLLSAQYAYLRRIGDSRKIMISAPSNAAIDHITKRIRVQGLVDGQGKIIHPNVLRLGIVQSQDSDITSCSLDHICQSKVVTEKNKTLKESHMTTIQIKQHLTALQKQTKNLGQQMFRFKMEQNHSQVRRLEKEINENKNECRRLQSLQFSFRRQKIISRKVYQEMEKNLIKQAEILIVTLSSSGGQKIEQVRGEIACLIVDEAAQATQPSLLIALQTGVDKVMLIGDPYQLPATTLSPDSNKTLFNRSLFQRFIDAGIQPYFLNIQYRMTPMIRQFPSQKFYQQRLTDGQSILKRETPQLLKNFAAERSVIFVDVKYGQEKVQQSSFCNQREAGLISKILKRYKLLESQISVGIITPYQAQRKILMKELGFLQNQLQNNKNKNPNHKEQKKAKPQNPSQKKNSIMINTIDSFQGQQKDLILISTVRANDRKQIGFLMDQRRINVSITRAKHAMIIIGNGDTLGSNEIWDGYLRFIEGKKLYFEVNSFEDEERLIHNLNTNDFFNLQSIRRRFYQPEELTIDPRKIKLREMNSDDFKKKLKKRVNYDDKEKRQSDGDDERMSMSSLSNVDNQFQRSPEDILIEQFQSARRIQSEQLRNSSQRVTPQAGTQYNLSLINPEYPLKKGPLPFSDDFQYQAEQLIKKKRKKQEETRQFEKVCQRMKQVEKQKANDDFYKFLFS